MKRTAILLTAVALLASTATIALADDDVETDGEPEISEERELNVTQMQKVDLLAGFLQAEFYVGEPGEEESQEAAEEQILDLRTGTYSTGWGAIFKLLQLAKASEVSLKQLLAEISEEGGGWAFGRRFKEIDSPADPGEDAPKNLGQLKKQNRIAEANRGKKPSKP